MITHDRHVLRRRGLKRWPPGLFGNSCNCSCGTTPPGAPVYYYYTRKTGTPQPATCFCPGVIIPTTLRVSMSSACGCIDGTAFTITRAPAGNVKDRFCGAWYQNGTTGPSAPCAPGTDFIAMPSGCIAKLSFQMTGDPGGAPYCIATFVEKYTFFGNNFCLSTTGGSTVSTLVSCEPFLMTHQATYDPFAIRICACCTDPVTVTFTVSE